MIVNPTPRGWSVIFQRAHGLLAVQLAHRWRADQRPARWIETLAAITEHDDGQAGFHGHAHVNAAGAPRNFAEVDFPYQQARQVSETSHYKSRWIGLLTSCHLTYLYTPKRELPGVADFLAEQQARQERWRRELKVKKAEVEAAYRLMRWCDQCSLILCGNQLPPGQRALEVSDGPDGTVYFIRQRADESLTVAPWPFQEEAFDVEVEHRLLEALTFADDPALVAAIEAAPVATHRWHLRR